MTRFDLTTVIFDRNEDKRGTLLSFKDSYVSWVGKVKIGDEFYYDGVIYETTEIKRYDTPPSIENDITCVVKEKI